MTRQLTILAGVDGSDHADAALRFAAALARALDARLFVAAAYAYPRAGRDDAVDEARARAEEVAERACSAVTGVRDVRAVLVAGDTAAAALHQAAQVEEADVLVVGSSERRRIAGIQPGSVTDAVLHHSPCPVAVVPGSQHEPAFARIGVAVDDGAAARAALDLALRVAIDAGDDAAELRLLHAAPPDAASMRPGVPAPGRGPAPDWLAALAADAGEHVPTKIVEETGHPARRLVELAAGLDLLVMGSRDLDGVRRVLLGSTSSHVVRHAACPVIVVPAVGPRLAPAAAMRRES
jgi:nucleotide-binding universal stress UspA family protein